MKRRTLAALGAAGLLMMGPAIGQANTPQDPHTMSKAQIQQIQQTLRGFGYNPGNVDGVWGPESEQALMQFQANRALPTTKGMIDESTASALRLTRM